MAFSKKQTGTPSTLGGAKKRRLVPWGKAQPQRSRKPKVRTGSRRKATPDASLFRMSYPANMPDYWPIEGGKRASPTVPTQDNADRHNAIVEHSFTRGGYS